MVSSTRPVSSPVAVRFILFQYPSLITVYASSAIKPASVLSLGPSAYNHGFQPVKGTVSPTIAYTYVQAMSTMRDHGKVSHGSKHCWAATTYEVAGMSCTSIAERTACSSTSIYHGSPVFRYSPPSEGTLVPIVHISSTFCPFLVRLSVEGLEDHEL